MQNAKPGYNWLPMWSSLSKIGGGKNALPWILNAYLLQSKAHTLFNVAERQPFLPGFVYIIPISQCKRNNCCYTLSYMLRCPLRLGLGSLLSPVQSSNLPTSTWTSACPPLASPFISSASSSFSSTGGWNFISSSTFSQFTFTREPLVQLKCHFTFWMTLSEMLQKHTSISSAEF